MIKVDRRSNSITKLFLILILSLLISGCSMEDLFTKLMGNINSSMQNSGAEDESFDISAVRFTPSDCDDPWFCKSNIRERVFSGVQKGVKYVAEQRNNVAWVNKVEKSETEDFYDGMKNTGDEDSRKGFLKQFTESHGSTVIIFGRYWGDDYNMTLRTFLYYSNRDNIAKASKDSTFTRRMPEDEMIEEIAKMIRDLLVQTLDG